MSDQKVIEDFKQKIYNIRSIDYKNEKSDITYETKIPLDNFIFEVIFDGKFDTYQQFDNNYSIGYYIKTIVDNFPTDNFEKNPIFIWMKNINTTVTNVILYMVCSKFRKINSNKYNEISYILRKNVTVNKPLFDFICNNDILGNDSAYSVLEYANFLYDKINDLEQKLNNSK
jgi:hypothetical protein